MTKSTMGPSSTAVPNSTGITVIVVGLGLAGLTAAIECHRKGHRVIGMEKSPNISAVGDVFSIGTNGTAVIRRWDDGFVYKLLTDKRCEIDQISVWNEAGELKETKSPDGYGPGEGFVISRADTVRTFYEYARRIGIEMHFGMRVTEYFENGCQAGIIANGQVFWADCIVASDGIHSKARSLISGGDCEPQKTGSAIYRSGYPAKHLEGVQGAQWLLEEAGVKDQLNHFIGKDITILVATGRKGKDVYWGCMHKSFHDTSEPWLQESDVDNALHHIKHWPIYDRLAPIIQKTPKGKCFDHLVLSASPLSRWVSANGRMILVGDAAHPLLPTTGQGANQAIEDGATLAICLELAGKERIPDGLRAMETLRSRRVAIIQEYGLELMTALHEADWEAVEQHKKPTMIVRPDWIFSHDCQQFTYQEFDRAMDSACGGPAYIPTNIPTNVV
ncbi:hypothetical protein CDV55_103820 [Aspergillus turcosus]|nr:hypothetical protein CDV55_103820 [Aspergillus turcosus]